MSDRHGGAGLVASLHSAVFAESDIESLVNGRLVGIIVIWQQGLLELALVFKGGLKRKETELDQKHGRWKNMQMQVTCNIQFYLFMIRQLRRLQ